MKSLETYIYIYFITFLRASAAPPPVISALHTPTRRLPKKERAASAADFRLTAAEDL